MESYGVFGDCQLLLPRPGDAFKANDVCNNELLHSGLWRELATKSCFYQASGYRHWLQHCPCEQCEFRRLEARGDPAAVTTSRPVAVRDEKLGVEYDVRGLRDNEFAVKGTYVDERVMPGFMYSVRNLARGPVFAEPRRLKAVGQGYARRLTFSGAGVDHFWSDSCPEGFGLRLVAMETGQQFALCGESGQQLGAAEVTWVAPEVVDSAFWVQGSKVCASAGAAFKVTVGLDCGCSLGRHDYEEIPMTGVAHLQKSGSGVAEVTKVEQVNLPGFERLHLVPLQQKQQQQLTKLRSA